MLASAMSRNDRQHVTCNRSRVLGGLTLDHEVGKHHHQCVIHPFAHICRSCSLLLSRVSAKIALDSSIEPPVGMVVLRSMSMILTPPEVSILMGKESHPIVAGPALLKNLRGEDCALPA